MTIYINIFKLKIREREREKTRIDKTNYLEQVNNISKINNKKNNNRNNNNNNERANEKSFDYISNFF